MHNPEIRFQPTIPKQFSTKIYAFNPTIAFFLLIKEVPASQAQSTLSCLENLPL